MLENLKKPTKERLCLLAKKSADLGKEDFEILQSVLEDPTWSSHALARELRENGFDIGRNTLADHREKRCLCFKA